MALVAAFACVGFATLAIVALVRTHAARWRERFGTELGFGLRQSFLYVDIGRLFRFNMVVLGALALGVLVSTGQPIVMVVALAVAGLAPGACLAWLRHRRLQRLVAQLPDAVVMIAGALRAGSSLAQAVAQSARELPAPLGRELDLVVREQRLGVGIDASMMHLERRAPLEEVTLLAAAVRIALESGGNLAETLERLGDTLRRKAALEGRIDALTAQGRLQGWVMAAMPLVVGAALFVIEPQAMRPLVDTWQGWCVCGGVVLLEALGLHVIRRIVDIDV
ncbi:MAG: type II secretion system F family protein [Burkholderiaceae bacterium]|jgi:tight adherence protein B